MQFIVVVAVVVVVAAAAYCDFFHSLNGFENL